MDPGSPDEESRAVRRDILRAMVQVGVNPAVIFAYDRTGYLITEGNADIVPDDALAAWDRALGEWSRMEPGLRIAMIEAMTAEHAS